MNDLFNLPLEIQTALASGYIGAWIATVGTERVPRAIDTAFRSLAFGLPAIVVFRLLPETQPVSAVFLALLASVILGSFWRMIGRTLAFKTLFRLKVHRDDGRPNAWISLIQQRPLVVNQLSVHTKDGRILYQNEHKYPEAHLGGMHFGLDGSIVMVVEEEELPDGTDQKRTAIADPEWGTRTTYIPADQIVRVNMR